MVEDIIYNLSNDVDVAETNQKIEEYRQRHKEEITRNRQRLSKETLELVDILAEEARLATAHSRRAQIEEEEERKIKAANKEKLIEDLMFSDADASEIISSHQASTAPTTAVPKFSTSNQQSRGGSSISLTGSSALFRSGHSGVSEAVPFVYKPPVLTSTGPPAPSIRQILDSGYCKSVRAATAAERAGGFHEAIACSRALQEAMAQLFYSHV
jgi:CDK-activating kinase assembly factor MAT1